MRQFERGLERLQRRRCSWAEVIRTGKSWPTREMSGRLVPRRSRRQALRTRLPITAASTPVCPDCLSASKSPFLAAASATTRVTT